MFFDDYPRFFYTSHTSPYRDRLNLRHEAIFDAHRDVFAGARVLDIASHDGRWSFAALHAGAAHVVGVEPRAELVHNAQRTFDAYEMERRRYRFLCGDVFDVLAQESLQVDVVLCLGFFYHTYRHTELLSRLRTLGPTYLFLDTQVVPGRSQPLVELFLDRVGREQEADQDAYSPPETIVVGWPSVPGVQLLLETYGFHVEQWTDWEGLLTTHSASAGLEDYADGSHVTARCRLA